MIAPTPISLARLQRQKAYFDREGYPTAQMQIHWQKTMEAIEDAFTSIDATVSDLADAVAAIAAAQAAAVAAQASADAAAAEASAASAAAAAAQATAGSNVAETALLLSYPGSVTIDGLDAGTDAEIDISAHTRFYGGGTSVAVSAGNMGTLAYSTKYYVYYDDPTRAGGAVTYVATTSAAIAAQTGNRHLVGAVTTPAMGSPGTTGTPVSPPGTGGL